MQQPLIGISGSMDLEETRFSILRFYTQAIHASGGVPVMLSPDMDDADVDACLSRMDGLLLAGGNDISPALFDQAPVEGLGDVNPLRDQAEMRLLNWAIAHLLPVLGICRGVQMMNVALGGTLYQDLPSQYRTPNDCPPMQHVQRQPGQYTSHTVCIDESSPLGQMIGRKEIWVNSFHHQAAQNVKQPAHACAWAPDGVIESIYLPDHPFFVGVQWHPERMFATDEPSKALFDGLIAAACTRKKTTDA
ncbi:MAG: gamma-glutamyl-gamma-aminobutyrate hydrolase family protein [Clostridia bacterium]|nr:gamma-glutamyl-gamma-aminobutyrate hydrolase family protein [Clostridia bacterium]